MSPQETAFEVRGKNQVNRSRKLAKETKDVIEKGKEREIKPERDEGELNDGTNKNYEQQQQ